MNRRLSPCRAVVLMLVFVLGIWSLGFPATRELIRSGHLGTQIRRVMSSVPGKQPVRLAADKPALNSRRAAATSFPALTITDGSALEGSAPVPQKRAHFVEVALSEPSSQTVSVGYSTSAGTATPGSDYDEASGTLTFAPGQMAAGFVVLIYADEVIEPNENFTVRLFSANNAAIARAQGTYVIGNDDLDETNYRLSSIPFEEDFNSSLDYWWDTYSSNSSGRIAVSPDNWAYEGPRHLVLDSSTPGTYALNEVILQPKLAGHDHVTLSFWHKSLGDENHAMPASFTGHYNADGVAISANGQKWYRVDAPDQDAANTYVQHTVDLDAACAAAGIGYSGGFFIKFQQYDDNAAGSGDGRAFDLVKVDSSSMPEVRVSNATVLEADEGASSLALFTVSLSKPSALPVSGGLFNSWTGTATTNYDFDEIFNDFFFAPGQTECVIAVRVLGDNEIEGNETFGVFAAATSNANSDRKSSVCTIIDNESPPVLSIGDAVVTEGDSGTKNANFGLTLSAAINKPVTVDYATADGSAVAGTDYTASNGTVTIPAGSTSATISVPVQGDTVDEANETFAVNLSGATIATLGDEQGTGTITDDDAAPTLSINDAGVAEGNAGSVDVVFNVTLSAASGQTVTVDYATANGTASAGTDYTATTGTSTFAPGTTTQTIRVPVQGDTLVEPDETFLVNLTGESNATIGDGQGTGTITNDDTQITLSINDVTVNEGNAGTSQATFTVSLSQAALQTVTVHYATADGTATAGTDYTATSGTLTFAPGISVQQIQVPILGETTVEPDETFKVTLDSASGADLADGQGIGNIINDDLPRLSVGSYSNLEGSSGARTVTLTVSLSASTSKTVTVNYATADGTAVAGSDYTSKSGTLTFAPGETSKNVAIVVQGDTGNEVTEYFLLQISNPANAMIGTASNRCTLVNDDFPNVSLVNASLLEGDSASKTGAVDIKLSSASVETVTVNYGTVDGTAVAGTDYTQTNGSVTFAPGETAKIINIPVLGDTVVEPDKTFSVQLQTASGANIAGKTATVTIVNDDLPSVTIGDVTLAEGNSGTANATFTVSLSAALNKPVTVSYATADGSAVAGSDYTASSGTVTFAAGETSKSITVAVLGDLVDEANETFFVNLSSATNAKIGDRQARGTITNDDFTPVISINDVTITEGNSGTKNAAFTIQLSGASPRTVKVNYATADGTALAASDYVATTGTLTFAPGQTSKTVNVSVRGDTAPELAETFNLALSSPVLATIGDGQGIGTIANDDLPSLSIAGISKTEGNTGSAMASLKVTLAPACPWSVSVKYATGNGTAASGSDYTAVNGTLTFAPGETSKTIGVSVLGDILVEANETVPVVLSNASNASIKTGQANLTITNDDTTSLSIKNVSVTEGGQGTTTNAVFTVVLSNASALPVTVTYGTANGTAAAGTDYTGSTGTLIFNPGEASKTISIPVIGDALVENNETFSVLLSNPVGAKLTNISAIGTIVNDDLPLVNINDVGVTEGNSGSISANFTVTLSQASPSAVTVSYSTANGTALAGKDYTAVTGKLTFSAGQTSKTISVPVLGDTIDELDETFQVNLTSPTKAVLGDGQGVGTIQDNEAAPAIGLKNVSVIEGQTGTKAVTFTVSLSLASSQAVTVKYATSDGTATGGSDYSAVNGTLTFAAGVLTKSVAVPIIGDIRPEADETFSLTLSEPTNATLGTAQATGTITNDDTNLPPLNAALTPVTPASFTGVPVVLKTIHRDPNTAVDLRSANILVSSSTAHSQALLGSYDAQSNQLFLRNDADTGWVAGSGAKPGDAVLLENSQGALDVAKTIVTRSGNDLTIQWNFTAKNGFTGPKPVWMFSQDMSGAVDDWEQKGTWTITISRFAVSGICKSMQPDAEFDGVNQAALPGVDVVLKDSSGKVIASAKSDQNGAYRFADVVPGQYVLSATLARADLQGLPLDPPNQTFTIMDADITAIRLALYSIFGFVKTPNASGVMVPTAGATVKLLNLNGVVLETQVTDSLGRYEFRNQTRRGFQLQVTAPGFGFPDASVLLPAGGMAWSPAARQDFEGQRSAAASVREF